MAGKKLSKRQGPRPLPIHLMSASTLWSSSKLALPFLKNDLLPWRSELDPRVQSLLNDLEGVEPADFAKAVDDELAARAELFIEGIERYRGHSYRRDLPDPPVIWQDGETRLLDYGPPDGHPLLVIPSLVNRSYILDLMAECSFLRFLSGAGIRPMLVDWGRPDDTARSFDLTDYIAGRLDQIFEAAVTQAATPISLLGYCMGGLMALALAQRRQRETDRLVLLATPWDFSSDSNPVSGFARSLAALLPDAFTAIGEVPTDALQTLFFMADPQLAIRKFSRFAGLDPQSPEARRFVAMEDWLNDGIPLALPTARDCFTGWYGENRPYLGEWRIAGRIVDPGSVTRRTLVVVSKTDRLVPAASARPLADALPNAALLEIGLGHVGLVVAERAPRLVWGAVRDHLLC